jgi:carboxyl-terminal processing protease
MARHALRARYILFLGMAVGAFFALVFSQAYVSLVGGVSRAAAAEGRPALEQFREIYELVRQRHVTAPDDSKLIEGAIKGMLQGLDPHSEYLDAQSYRTVQEEAVGIFGSLGLQVAGENGLVKVVNTVANSHAAKAGLKPGDLITRLDGKPVRGLTLNQAVERMRGPVDSTIRLTITRRDQREPIEVLVARDLIRVQTVSTQAIGGDVGYIKITKFNDLTGEGLRKALQDLSTRVPANRLRGYVLDLRNNPGGVLEQAVSVSNAFLSSGDIVTTRGRNPEDDKVFTASASDDWGKGKPLIVLINGGSASAAEIVAGALQDHKRATVLGTRSFGKGSVQSTEPISGDNDALMLTTALYYTPNGRSIQAKGITPDIEVIQEEPEAQKLRDPINSEAMLRNHLKGEGEERAGSEAYVPPDSKDDRALKMAVDLLRGTRSHPAFPPK